MNQRSLGHIRECPLQTQCSHSPFQGLPNLGFASADRFSGLFITTKSPVDDRASLNAIASGSVQLGADGSDGIVDEFGRFGVGHLPGCDFTGGGNRDAGGFVAHLLDGGGFG